jgi:hypothetical protein
MEMSGQLCSQAALSQGKQPLAPIEYGCQCSGEGKNLLLLAGIKHNSSVIQFLCSITTHMLIPVF